jgi:hypothetical protein
MTEAPYGLGPYALSLFMGVAVRYLGDELRLRLNPAGLGYTSVNEPEVIIDLATGKYPLATIERRERTPSLIEMVDGVYRIFTEVPAAAGTHCSQLEAWHVLLAWWKKRTHLERTSGIYPDESTSRKFTEMLTKDEPMAAASQSFLDDIKVVYGYSQEADLDLAQVKGILEKLKENKVVLETHTGTIKDNLIKSIGALFSTEGKTYMDYTDAIRNWVNGLHPDQKDHFAAWQTSATLTLIDALPKLTDIKQMLLNEIPAAPGFIFGKVDDWSYDRSEDYEKKFQDSLKKINEGLPKVPPPTWSTSVKSEQSAKGDIFVKFHGQVTLKIDAPEDVMVRVTKNEDPRSALQFQPIIAKASWNCDIESTCAYYLVSQSPKGDFSKVIKLSFRNLDDDYKLIPETPIPLDPGERFYSFRNPVYQQGLTVLVRDLFEHLKVDGKMSPEEIVKAVADAVKAELLDKG